MIDPILQIHAIDPMQQTHANDYYSQNPNRFYKLVPGKHLMVVGNRLRYQAPTLIERICALFGIGPAANKTIEEFCEKNLLKNKQEYNDATAEFKTNRETRMKQIESHPPFWQLKKESHIGDAWIHIACREDDLEAVLAILQKTKDAATITGKDGKTPLMIASERGNVEIIHALLEAFPTLSDHNSYTDAFHLAIEHEQIDAIQTLIEKNPLVVNSPNKDHKTGLHICCTKVKTKALEIIDILLQNNADTNITDRFGNTPLYYTINEKKEALTTHLEKNMSTISHKDGVLLALSRRNQNLRP